ncbi:MAG: hypothetical protein NVS9B10_17490 [Nevskia sp.]
MSRSDSYAGYASPAVIPQRKSLLVYTLIFTVILTALVCMIGARVLSVGGPGRGLGLAPTVLVAAVILLGACVSALIVFLRLQLPLETAQASNEEKAFRIEALESVSATAIQVEDIDSRQALNAVKREAAALSEQLALARSDLALAERQLATRAQPLAGAAPDEGNPQDPLTGMPCGSALFEIRLGELAEIARRSGDFHGLLAIGIDNFGAVHDRFGPAAGEENIWQIAQQVREVTPAGGEVFRLSAKHFAILLPQQTDEASFEIAQRLCADISGREFAWEGQSVPTSVSIGVVSIGLADRSEADIVERAFHALGQARQLGGARVYKESLLPMLERRAREKSLGDWLKEKLKTRQLRLAAQPIMPARPGANEPGWAELLLRIEDDDGVWLTPDHYVDVLERMQLTSLIDRWVLETALREGARCRALTESGGRLSINIFGSSLLRDSFLVQLRDVLSRSALPTQQICFELDEAFVVQHGSRVAAFVHAIAEFGCQLALDRYRGGAGLSALRQFPAQYIKLHESLVQRQTTDLIDRAHVDWLVTSAHLTGAKVVASAVRDEDVLKRLRQSGVDYVQGFAVAPPSPYAL